jgi:hypothetical protein
MGQGFWNSREAHYRKKTHRNQTIVQSVLFVALMLGLIYVLWATDRCILYLVGSLPA